MKPSLQVRLSQHLALTPQLQQSIRLLQLSTLELHQEVEQMLEANPFLEPEDENAASPWDTPAERERADRVADAEGDREATPEASLDDGAAEIRADDFGTTEREDWANGTEGDDFDGIQEMPSAAVSGGDSDDMDGQDRSSASVSLQDHLRAQVVGMRMETEDRLALEVLIDSLDGDGYLADPLDEIAERLADMLDLALEDEPAADGEADAEAAVDAAPLSPRATLHARLSCALRWLQCLEPLGVGARDLGECLSLQLRVQPQTPAHAVALAICAQHLELLARRDMKRLVAATNADEDLVRAAQALIVACEPKPGRPFADAESNVIVPDVIVRKNGRGLSVVLNPDVMPKLRINDLYAQAVRGQRGAANGMGTRLQEARWFMKNIQQRFDTILRVSKAIVERQKGFFTHGAIAMKPLVLREIADELGLHESTISRVTTAKYMATLHGTYELKYFFGSSLNTDAGGNASSTAVRALIEQFVKAEDPAKPLSDSQISDMLEEQGIQVARRTVAKYREALKIAPASQRKTI
jgi:RNA polymerase sigma-54 factor